MQNNKTLTLNNKVLNDYYKKAFNFRFFPDSEQTILLEQIFGSVRFVYNKTLDYSIQHYASRQTTFTDDFGDLITITNPDFKSLSSNDRVKYLNELKFNFPWLHDGSSIALQQSIRHLNNSYNNFFNKVKQKVKNPGFPKFKKKGNRNSFKIVGTNSLHFDKNGRFTLPKFKKPLDIRFSREFDRSKITSVTVSKEPNGHYFISFLSEENYKILPSKNEKLAFDSGIKNNITSFNGQLNKDNKPVFNIFNLPNLSSIVNRIKFIQKELRRKVKGSNNRNKFRIKLAKLHAKKENIVKDFYHKLSFNIVNDNQVIIAEDLNLSEMKENKSSKLKNVSKSLQHISLSKIYEYIEYKALWYGKTFIRADKYYPSSKLCSTSQCEYIYHELQLNERTWKCPSCGKVHDRDNNAALNLFNYDEHNAKRIINNVLAYHKQNKKLLAENNKQSAKIKLNNKLIF